MCFRRTKRQLPRINNFILCSNRRTGRETAAHCRYCRRILRNAFRRIRKCIRGVFMLAAGAGLQRNIGSCIHRSGDSRTDVFLHGERSCLLPVLRCRECNNGIFPADNSRPAQADRRPAKSGIPVFRLANPVLQQTAGTLSGKRRTSAMRQYSAVISLHPEDSRGAQFARPEVFLFFTGIVI